MLVFTLRGMLCCHVAMLSIRWITQLGAIVATFTFFNQIQSWFELIVTNYLIWFISNSMREMLFLNAAWWPFDFWIIEVPFICCHLRQVTWAQNVDSLRPARAPFTPPADARRRSPTPTDADQVVQWNLDKGSVACLVNFAYRSNSNRKKKMFIHGAN